MIKVKHIFMFHLQNTPRPRALQLQVKTSLISHHLQISAILRRVSYTPANAHRLRVFVFPKSTHIFTVLKQSTVHKHSQQPETLNLSNRMALL